MEEFKNLYTINKTLRFGLKGYRGTIENIKKSGLLTRDEERNSDRKEMQELFDKIFKDIIINSLKDLKLDIDRLKEYERAYNEKTKSKKKEIDNIFKTLKVQINDVIYKEISFLKNGLKDKKVIDDIEIENVKNKKFINPTECMELLYLCDLSDENKKTIDRYNKFTTYFSGFFNNRKHALIGDSKGSVSFRLIDENLRTYYENAIKLNRFPDALVKQLLDKGYGFINDISGYNNFFSQIGITKYNEIIGGLNKIINLYKQKNKIKLPILKRLDKMILMDSETGSFRFDAIDNDEELIDRIREITRDLSFIVFISLPDTSLEHIYIKYDNIGYLPGITFSVINDSILKDYDNKNVKKKKGKSYEDNRKKKIKEEKYSIMKLSKVLKDNQVKDIDIVTNLINKYHEIIIAYESNKDNFNKICWDEIVDIKQSDKVVVIKDLLDSVKEIQRFFNLFEVLDENSEYDFDFYNWLSENKEKIDWNFNATYNMTRNYLTKKQYSTDKFKLNFDEVTLASGWDDNKEKDCLAFIMRRFNDLRKDYDYFLGIWNKDVKTKDRVIPFDENGSFEKMFYKQYQDPKKMLPKQFMCKKWDEIYPISNKLKIGYANKKHIPGGNFDIRFLHELINHYKYGLINHENKYQETFNFKLKPTEDYNSYDEFIKDIEKDNYIVKFNKVGRIDEFVDEGKIFVFQIWSKDFSEYSKGKKNLNTIYFESLFSNENLIKGNFKLDGEAELFLRPASLFYDKETLKLGHHYEKLKDKFDYPIVKDKRYTEDKYFIHMPIKINRCSKNISGKELNSFINDNIKQFRHIIGIDRGERHLIYLSIIDVDTGKIIKQKDLDGEKGKYRKKLEKIAGERIKQRRTWETIENIKDFKKGYLSYAVNEIREMQEKYNALIVLEDLNFGFKNSRIKIEKQIYQSFELDLIKKFNYLIDKNNSTTYTNGIQLTNYIDAVDKIGKQTGIVLFIPAWNTSNIDPITGYVNLLNANDLRYKNQEDSKKFIKKIDNIYFEDGVFKFEMDFSKWNNRYEKTRKKWTLTSYGTRVRSFRNINKNNRWDYEELDLTSEFSKILKQDGTLVKDDTETCKQFMFLFKLMLQLRNSIANTEIDYIISPVVNNNGINFDSRKSFDNLPLNADANGAYNIARKGLMAVNSIINKKDKPMTIDNEDYLLFIQNGS